MPLLARAVAVAGGRRRLLDLGATAPSAGNWQEPLGHDSGIPSWSWPPDTKNQVLFGTSLVVFVIVFCCVLRLSCKNKEDDELDTSRFVPGLWSNDDNAEGVSAPPPQPLQEHQPPESGDDHAPRSNSGEGDRPPQRRRWRRRRQQPPAVAEVPAADVELALPLGDVQLTQAGVDWVLANMELLAPAANVDMAPAADVEIAPAPEPAPTLKCTYRRADGWAEGTCSVCLSELVDGEMVRVLTGCMHCFHATCIETWLRQNQNQNRTCPLCRAPVVVRGRRRRRMTQA